MFDPFFGSIGEDDGTVANQRRRRKTRDERQCQAREEEKHKKWKL